jgi:mono/diheme cytochrome c family protein
MGRITRTLALAVTIGVTVIACTAPPATTPTPAPPTSAPVVVAQPSATTAPAPTAPPAPSATTAAPTAAPSATSAPAATTAAAPTAAPASAPTTAPTSVPPTATVPPKPDANSGQAVWASKVCTRCHGATGQGGIGPKLAGTALGFADFTKKVRTGEGAMPAFPVAQVSDAEMQLIYDYLKSLR